MKILSYLLLSIIVSTNGFGQNTIAGEYTEYPSPNNFTYGGYLKLNCDNTFFRSDSAYLISSAIRAYGKWRIVNDTELTLEIDSIWAWGKTDYSNTKLKYIIRDEKIYKKAVTKKEYIFFTKGRKKTTLSETFVEFQKRELGRFYKEVIKIKCN